MTTYIYNYILKKKCIKGMILINEITCYQYPLICLIKNLYARKHVLDVDLLNLRISCLKAMNKVLQLFEIEL